MKKPVMIAFDYGQTIIDEHPVDFLKGTSEIMKYAAVNKYGKTPEDVYRLFIQLRSELGIVNRVWTLVIMVKSAILPFRHSYMNHRESNYQFLMKKLN